MKKTLLGLGIGAISLIAYLGFTPGEMTPEQIAQVEARAQKLFGGDKEEVKKMIFNEMLPAKVKLKGKDWELTGTKFKTVLREKADDGWDYIESGKTLKMVSKGFSFDGNKVKTKANSVVGEIKKGKVDYLDALGEGIDILITQDNYALRKTIEIESLESLGEIPEGAEYLEFDFEISGDFVLPEGRFDERIPFGENSFLNKIQAWDSGEEEECAEAYGIIDGNIITKRIPIEWLLSATFPVKTDVDITFGSTNTFNAAVTSDISVSALDSTHFVVAYGDAGGIPAYGEAVVGVISGTTISSYGTKSTFNAAITSNLSVSALDSTHFVVAYADGGNSYYGTAIVGEVSGTTISSYGAGNVFNTAFIDFVSTAALDSTHFVVTYEDGGNSNYGTAIVGEVSGTTISSYGAENVFNSAATDYTSVSALDSTRFVVVYRDVGNSNYGTAIVGEVSGTTINSYGAENVFNSAATLYISTAALDSTHFVVAYRDDGNSSYGTAIVGEVSGTTISSYGAENVFNSATAYFMSVSILGSTHFVVTYRDTGNSNYGTAIVGEVSGTTIDSYGAENVFNSAGTRDLSVSALDSTHFVVVYRDDSTNYGTAIIGSIPGGAVNAIFFGSGL